ncbi:hypothetical protein N483_19960 [Pseudoalteromonas luteoviolacea NCIMB 1944]|nr:hypothetical protein N483_19960 [Pseudoalteromonas luteoviolacea NCIMB 1944]
MAFFRLCSKPFITELTVIKDINPRAIPAIEKKEMNETNAFPLDERLYLSPTNRLTD